MNWQDRTWKLLKEFSLIILFLFVSVLGNHTYASSSQKAVIIRDAEIEDTIKDYLSPLFKAAGLNPKLAEIYLVNTPSVNASATLGHTILINTGLLLKAKSAAQVIGVLAHETAHISGGHLINRFKVGENSAIQSLIGLLGGIAAGAAGQPEAAMGIILGTNHLLERNFLRFSRSQEGAADQGAVRILEKLDWPVYGLLEFMELLNYDELLSDRVKDPYVLTHPLSATRVDFLREYLTNKSSKEDSLPAGFEDRFNRIKTKIAAFTQPIGRVLLQYKESDSSPLARYARAIAHMKRADLEIALKEINSLLRDFSNDAFYWELKGQILFENGHIKESSTCYEKAVTLRPDITFLRVLWAQTLVEQGNPQLLSKALAELLRAKVEDRKDPLIWKLLAVAHGRLRQPGLAALSLAELALLNGEFDEAQQQAKRCRQLLGSSSETLRAGEILQEAKRLKEQKLN